MTHFSGQFFETPYGMGFAGHFDPIHKEKGALAQILPIFEKFPIVVGDFNTTPRRLSKYIGNNWHFTESNTYNPPDFFDKEKKKTIKSDYTTLDNIFIKNKLVKEIKYYSTLFDKKEKEEIITTSDHCPIVCKINNEFIITTWNVSDPFFWCKKWESASARYNKANEEERKMKVMKIIYEMTEYSNIICLQEVPIDLYNQIAKIKGFSIQSVKTHSKYFFDYETPYIVVLTKEN